MTAWIVAAIAALVIGSLVTLGVLMSRGTVYIMRSDGFTGLSRGKKLPAHHTDENGLKKAIAALLPGDSFDMLWVSKEDDEYNGLMLSMTDGVPTLSASFNTSRQQAELKSFRDAMAIAGFKGEEDSQGFNGGLGEEFRETEIEFTLPKSPEEIAKAVNSALENLFPGRPSGYFVRGYGHRLGRGVQRGIRFEADRDPLEGLL